MGEFTETLKRYRSRIGLRDATTAITSASIVIVLALIAFAFQSNSDDVVDTASGTTDITDTTGDLPEATDGTGAEASSKPGASGVPGTGGGPTSSGAVTAPEKVPPNVALTKEVVKVGVAYLEDPGTANAAAGFGGVGQVDQKRAIETMLKEINKNPPYGRKAVPVYYSFTTDDVTSKGAERIAQEACAKWTQDNKVFMAWSGGGDNTLNSCLNKAGVVQLGGGGGLSWSKTYKDYPLLVEPGDAGLDRLAQFEVDQLFKQKFFSGFKQNSPPYTPQVPADKKAADRPDPLRRAVVRRGGGVDEEGSGKPRSCDLLRVRVQDRVQLGQHPRAAGRRDGSQRRDPELQEPAGRAVYARAVPRVDGGPPDPALLHGRCGEAGVPSADRLQPARCPDRGSGLPRPVERRAVPRLDDRLRRPGGVQGPDAGVQEVQGDLREGR